MFIQTLVICLLITLGTNSEEINHNLVADNISDSSMVQKNKIEAFNRTVLNIIESTVLTVGENHTDKVQPLWNIMDPLVRLALLNQTQVQAIWNATKSLMKNKTKLEWEYIPNEVRIILLEQSNQQSYLNLTFAQWGWVRSDSCFASTNLYSLLSQEQIDLVPVVESILRQMKFNHIINTTAIKETFFSHHRILLSSENNENFEINMPYLDFPLREFTLSSNQPSIFAVYSQALGDLLSFLIQIKYFLYLWSNKERSFVWDWPQSGFFLSDTLFQKNLIADDENAFIQETIDFNNENWTMSREEKTKYANSFHQLNPINGLLSGEQTKEFFLKSNLPKLILAQIWDLADTNKDGRFDQNEFSIACFLIKKLLKNSSLVLPKMLPPSLLSNETLISSPIFIANKSFKKSNSTSFSPLSYNFFDHDISFSPNGIISAQTDFKIVPSIPLHVISPAAKSRYKQIFQLNDSDSLGFITKQQIRILIVQNGLDNTTFTKIWNLADCDKDEKLSHEEFEIAMHLCEYYKAGNILPSELPIELQHSEKANQKSHRSVSFTDSSSAEFEAKRRENFERGNAILEAKRKMLRDAEEKEKKELEMKERNEAERKLQLKHQLEKKHFTQLEKQLEAQRAIDQKHEEDRRKLAEQHKTLHEKLLREKHIEWEIIRLTHEKLILNGQNKSESIESSPTSTTNGMSFDERIEPKEIFK